VGETQEISVKPRNGSALALEKPLSIERNDMEYWKYAASETVFWNARRQPCVARRARSKKFFSMRASKLVR
jgi:hypothetical protein